MSGDDLPYHLRPNKFIDRQVFIDLLTRAVPIIGADKYIYTSMGGKHLVDHSMIYRSTGISNLFSFDVDDQVVLRQNFNRPIDKALCREMTTGSLPGSIDSIMNEFKGATNLIVWLDYTDPHARLTQLQELVETAIRLQPGDIIRITLNSSLGTLEDAQAPTEWKDEGFGSPNEFRAARLREQLGDFAPANLERIGESEFATVLSACISLAFSKAEAQRDDLSFRPVLLTTYRDGQRMVTATCIAVPRPDLDSPKIDLFGWPFMPESWADLTLIEAPDLSLREKLKIDEHLSQEPDQVLNHLGFLPAKNESRSARAIASYQRLHRYYPAFHHIYP